MLENYLVSRKIWPSGATFKHYTKFYFQISDSIIYNSDARETWIFKDTFTEITIPIFLIRYSTPYLVLAYKNAKILKKINLHHIERIIIMNFITTTIEFRYLKIESQNVTKRLFPGYDLIDGHLANE